MTNEEEADDLLHHIITSWNDVHKNRYDTVQIILAYADEIRRECSEIAEELVSNEPWSLGDLRAAIMGKEAKGG